MPRPARIIMPPKDCEPWLYEILRSLQLNAQSAASGLASISRGEVPDGSGDPLAVDLSDYFFLPGRPGGQIGYGGTASLDNLEFHSNTETDGLILFGANSAYDEATDRLGLGDTAPAAVLHIAQGSSSPLLSASDIDLGGGSVADWTVVGAVDATTALQTNDGGTTVVFINNLGFGLAPELQLQFPTLPDSVPLYTVRIWARQSDEFNPGGSTGGADLTARISLDNGDIFNGPTVLLSSIPLGASYNAYDFAIDTTGTPAGTGSLGASALGLQFNTGAGYQITFRVTLIEVFFGTPGGAADLTHFYKDAGGTLISVVDALGRVGVGTGSGTLGAMLTLEADSASTVGQIVFGASGQTANLLEFRDSTSTLLARVTSAGEWDGPISTTSAIEVTDSTFSILDNADPTKIAKFECSSIGAGQTRTFTFPDASGTLVTLENNQTITGVITHNPGSQNGPLFYSNDNSGAFAGTGPALIDSSGSGFVGELQCQVLTDNQAWMFPNGSGTIVLTGVSASLLGSTTSRFISSTNVTGARFEDTTTGTKRLRFIMSGSSSNTNNALAFVTTASRTFTFRDTAGGVVVDSGSALTSGRVPFATTGGALTDSSLFLFSAASGLTLSALNLITDTTTGMKIGTATTQKLGFWNATPIVQPTTAIAAATFTANTSGIADDSATFDGYTIGQVVKALRNSGLLA